MCNTHPYTETGSLSVTVSVTVTEVTVSFFLMCYRYEQQKTVHVVKKACSLERWQAKNEGKIGLVAP